MGCLAHARQWGAQQLADRAVPNLGKEQSTEENLICKRCDLSVHIVEHYYKDQLKSFWGKNALPATNVFLPDNKRAEITATGDNIAQKIKIQTLLGFFFSKDD